MAHTFEKSARGKRLIILMRLVAVRVAYNKLQINLRFIIQINLIA